MRRFWLCCCHRAYFEDSKRYPASHSAGTKDTVHENDGVPSHNVDDREVEKASSDDVSVEEVVEARSVLESYVNKRNEGLGLLSKFHDGFLLFILSFLEPDELCVFALVSRACYVLQSESELWRPLAVV